MGRKIKIVDIRFHPLIDRCRNARFIGCHRLDGPVSMIGHGVETRYIYALDPSHTAQEFLPSTGFSF